jgi:hypothetical protein
MVSTNRPLFKGEVPRFSADLVHPLSSERPFKFLRHLIRPLDWIIAMSDKNICSAVFYWHGHVNGNGYVKGNWHGDGHGHGHWRGHGHETRHGIRTVASYGLPVTHHGASSNSAMNMWRKFQQRYKLVAPLPNENYDMLIFKNLCRYWDFSLNDVLAELEISVWVYKRPLPEVCSVIGN